MDSRIDSARFGPPSRATRIPNYARTRPLARAITPLNTRLNLHGDATAAVAYLRCGLRRSQLRALLRDDRGAVSRSSCRSIDRPAILASRISLRVFTSILVRLERRIIVRGLQEGEKEEEEEEGV